MQPQTSPELQVIVDFAIEDNHVARPLVYHGLGGEFAQVDNGKQPMGETHSAIARNPEPCAVGSAGEHLVAHSNESCLIDGLRVCAVREGSRQTAHSAQTPTESRWACEAAKTSR